MEQNFFSRDELLEGMPARRASTLWFAIESRSAQLARRDRQVGAYYLTEQTEAEQEHAFLHALAQGRQPPQALTIQDLERYAPLWAPLVPEEAALRAAAAQLAGSKYRFRETDVPGLRAALGLDTPGVQAAFQRLYGLPLGSIYAPALSARETLRWGWARLRNRLEALPPFWTAFALTLTETVGAGIMALPIALAGLGPMGGVLVLAVLGLVNCLTIAGLSEAIVRNGNLRYGKSYFGRLVRDYFGPPGVLVMTIALSSINILALLAFDVGVGTTLEGATGIQGGVWVGLLFLVQLYFLRRESISATAASALVIGGINIVLILALTGLALPHTRWENFQLAALPDPGGSGFAPEILGVVFGVVLTAYFGHTSAGNAAKVVLRRDPGGKSLIWGNVAALLVAAVLYILWVLGVNGSIPAERLVVETGTALVPLAEVVGPIVYLLGSIFVVLAMGMASIYMCLGLYYQIRERLPAARRETGGPSWQEHAPGPRTRLANPGVQKWIAASPVILLTLGVEWLLWTDQETFTGVLGFIGALGVPIMSGVFPVLLLVASRRKADYPASESLRWLGHPLLVGLIYLLFMTSLVVHGLFLWQDPLWRALALGTALILVVLTAVLVRRGAFQARRVVELKVESEPFEHAAYQVISSGRPAPAQVRLDYSDGRSTQAGAGGNAPDFPLLQEVCFNLPPAPVQELKVWAHAVTATGDSEPLAVQAHLTAAGETQTFDLRERQGAVIVRVDGGPVEVCLRRDGARPGGTHEHSG